MTPPITRPTLILNEAIARRNIARMADKARRSGVRFRPHFKTHQSAVIGEWFRAEGVSAITVSSVVMAEYFAEHGWDDITLAFPVNWLEIEAINALAARIKLGLLVESVETARFLGERLAVPANAWLKIDAGYGRTGLAWDDFAGQKAVAGALAEASPVRLRGLLTHSGQTYHAHGATAIRAVWEQTAERMNAARDALAAAGFPGLELAPGDTPGCAVVDDFPGVDEIRPGNFVFFDAMQVEIGACGWPDVAVAVACPVVARHPERGQLVIHGGAVHLSKEYLTVPDGRAQYGLVALPVEVGWGAPVPGVYVTGLSQEHGIVSAPPDFLARVQVGDLLMILPVHSCLTANLLGRYRTTLGEIIPMARF
jgi:D-serine deaminase-like pyridoxal phosphate-dependent protein